MFPFGLHKNKKNWRTVSGFFLLLLVAGFVVPYIAQAADSGSWWNFTKDAAVDTLTLPFRALIYYGLFVPIGWLASIAVTIFGWAVDPGVYGVGGLFNKGSVYAMWKFIRDFLNLFFILVLLYTAFTIVFQVASNYKKTLLSIVLAALFVNFSFPLTRVMIDAGNVPMYYFINLMMGPSNNSIEAAKGSFGTVLSASKLQNMLMPTGFNLYTGDTSMTKLVVAVIFLFLFSMALLTLAVLLVVRLAALLLLVVFSPIGFAASIIPGMKKYSGMWWDKLTQYVLFGPAAMLMLYITTRFFEEIGKDNTLQKIKETTQAGAVAGQGDFFASTAMFAITIIMLWMTIGIANSFSIAGAGAVTGAAQKFSKWAGKKTTVSPAMFAGRKIDSKLAGSKNFSFLSPGAWKLAIKQRGEEQKHKDEQPIKQAAAKRQDWINDKVSRVTGAGSTMLEGGVVAWPGAVKKIFTEKGKDHTDHNFAQTQAQSGEYRKEISDVSTQSDYVINEMKAAMATGNTAKVDAALQILAKNNDLNDMLTGLSKEDVDKYKIKDVDELGRAVVSSENMMKALQGILKDAGERDDEVMAKRMMVIGDHATGAGNFAFGGMTKFDQGMNDGHGGFRVARKAGEKDESGNVIKEDEQAAWASGKVKNIESQERQRKIHPDSMFTRTAEGGFGDINGNVAKGIIQTFTQGDVKNAERSRDDMKAAVYNAFKNIDEKVKDANGKDTGVYKYAGFREAYNDPGSAIFKDYVHEVKRIKEKIPDKDKKSGSAPASAASGGGAAPTAPN